MMSGTEEAWGGEGLSVSELMLEVREREIASSLLQRFSPCLGLRRVLRGTLSPLATAFSCHLASSPSFPSSILFSLLVSTFMQTSPLLGSLNLCSNSPCEERSAAGGGV